MSQPANATIKKKDLRYYSLDFWRGVACLMVAVFHAIPYVTENPAHVSGNIISKKIFSGLSQGWAGVPMFFVISGYCIAAACEAAMERNVSTKTYFFRRFKRIYPPFWILFLGVVAVHYCFVLVSGSDYLARNVVPLTMPWAMSAWQWIGTATLTEGWRDHLVGEPSRFFMTHAWSLGYEEQFYFVCGMAMLTGRKWFYRSLAGLSVVVFFIALVNNTVMPLPVDGFFFDGRWLMFAAGVLVFYVVQFGDARSRKRAMYLLSACAVLAVVWALTKPMQIARQEIVSFLFAIALIPLFNFDLRIAQSRWLRPVMWCGVMCYSLYLVHYPVELLTTQLLYNAGVQGEWSTLFITVPLSLCASLLCAWAFYLLVERRFLNSAPILPTRAKPVPADLPVSVNA